MGEKDSLATAQAAARAFAGEQAIGELTPLGGGLIHQTFAVPLGGRSGGGAHSEIVIQRVNTDVFPDPQALMQNLERITTHLRETHVAEGSSMSSARCCESCAPAPTT